MFKQPFSTVAIKKQSGKPRLACRLLVYALLLLLVFGPWLAWETDRNRVRRWLYPAKGWLVAASTQCDAQAPAWLHQAAQTLARHFDSPANQLVYWPTGGQMQGCVNGWHDMPLFSPRVTAGTRFRMASLSKVVTFIGLLSAPDGAGQPAGGQQAAGVAQPALANTVALGAVGGATPAAAGGVAPVAAAGQQWPAWMNAPLAQVLAPDVPAASYKDARVAAMRVRHLLNHSAGFDRLKEADPMLMRDITPWCPHAPERLASEPLQFAPGTRYSYANVGYCLAPVVYERVTQQDFFHHLSHTLQMQAYGMAFIDQQDAELNYNFMHQEFYGPDFMHYFDASALRTSMGMTGNAKGLARFVRDNWQTFTQFHAMHDPAIACNDAQQDEGCFDGVMERKTLDGQALWAQGGYLPGMGAVLLVDEAGNLLIWLGAGEAAKAQENTAYLEGLFAKNSP